MKSPPKCRRNGRARAARGVAYVEATIVVVFLVIIWCSIVYVTRLHEARQSARLTARECAWSIAVAGCKEVPPQCQGAGIGRTAGDAALEDDFVPVEDTVRAEAQDDEDGIASASRDMVDAEVKGLLFERVTSQGARRVQQPIRYGGKEVQVSTSYSLPCNSTPSSVGDHAGRFFDAVVDRIF